MIKNKIVLKPGEIHECYLLILLLLVYIIKPNNIYFLRKLSTILIPI